MNILNPSDDYWKLITINSFDKMDSIDQDNYYYELLPRDKYIFDVINNIYGLVSFGINFSSKFINLDETVKRFVETINLDIKEHKNQEKIIPENLLVCESLLGINNFVRFPAGVINYHLINKAFYLVSNIALMLTKGSFPCSLINEFNDDLNGNNKIKNMYKIVRSSGYIQNCIILENSSIFYLNTKKIDNLDNSNNEKNEWRITVCFNDHKNLTDSEINEDNFNLSTKKNWGLLTKSVYLHEFLDMNNINTLTLNKEKIKNKIKNSIISFDKEKLKFKNLEDIYDDTLNNNFSYIQTNVINYFLEKLDLYCESVKLYLNKNNISCIII